MNQKEVFKKIGGIIKELNDQYEFLQTTTDELNNLEVELFVANAHFLADHVEILYKLNLQNSDARGTAQKPEKSNEPKYFEPVVQQMKHAPRGAEQKTSGTPLKQVEIEATESNLQEDQPIPEIDLTSESTADTHSYIHEEPETIRHELILDESQIWEDEDEEAPEENEELKTNITEVTNTPSSSLVSSNARFVENEHKDEIKNNAAEEEVITINQKISSQLGNTPTGMTEQLSVKPVSDIKLAITLNDKLLFVKELFNGYNLAYSEAVEILNRFNSFEEAMRFLNTNYVAKNNWEGKPEIAEKFYALLKRRYA